MFWRVTTFLRYLSTLRSFSQLLTKNLMGLAAEVRLELTYKRVKAVRHSFWLLCYGCGGRNRTADLLFMGQARFYLLHSAILRRDSLITYPPPDHKNAVSPLHHRLLHKKNDTGRYTFARYRIFIEDLPTFRLLFQLSYGFRLRYILCLVLSSNMAFRLCSRR